MFPAPRAIRASVAALAVIVLTGLSVAVPLLDQGRDPGALAVSEPGTPAGYVDHDHAICLQHGAAAWSPAMGAELPSERLVPETDTPVPADERASHSFRRLPQSRAPPAV